MQMDFYKSMGYVKRKRKLRNAFVLGVKAGCKRTETLIVEVHKIFSTMDNKLSAGKKKIVVEDDDRKSLNRNSLQHY